MLAALPGAAAVTVKKSEYAKLPDGAVTMFTVTNAKGMEAKIITWGGVGIGNSLP